MSKKLGLVVLIALLFGGLGWLPVVTAGGFSGVAAVGPAEIQEQTTVRGWMRSPSYSTQGRLVFEVNGDIWVSGVRRERADLRAGELVQVTSGPQWDRDPTWTPDGAAIVFASDSGGSTNLWRIVIDDDGRITGTAQLTSSQEPDTDPTVAPDGTIVFVRGRNATADLWVRTAEGEERRLKETDGAERGPVFSPAGDELLYLAGRQLRRVTFDEEGEIDEDETRLSGTAVAAVAWSPDGERIAYGTTGSPGAVYVAPADGRFSNLIAEIGAAPAWSPDGEQLVLAELAPNGPGYNGDPDRVGDRALGDIFTPPDDVGRVWVVDAPAAFVTEPEAFDFGLRVDREEHNGEAFDRVWDRLAALYFSEGDAASAWAARRETYRPQALAAGSDAELEDVIHAMLRERPPAREAASGRAAVSSAHPISTAAGVEILEAGGNVVDAAVAVSFALGVVEPDASGLGGYGQMVVYLTDMEEPVVIEFLTRAPQAATLENGALDNPTGPMRANVPGVPRGMELAYERYGSGDVEWSDIVQPAIRAAEDGFVLDDAFTTTLSLHRDRYLEHDSTEALFFRDGEPLQAGDLYKNPDLAWTLKEIAEGGADAFYEGEVARRIVEDLRGKGNAVTMNDMARYFAVERPAVVGEYRGHTIYSATPPVSGGVSLVAKLNLLDNVPEMALYTEDAASLHALIEAWKLQPSSRGRIADPSLWPVDIGPVIDPETADKRWAACFDTTRATTGDDLETGRGGVPACAEEEEKIASVWGEDILDCQDSMEGCTYTGTTSFAVADGDGNFVAVTQTLGTWGGNFYVTPGVGFIYNDKLNSYGGSGYGARLPYARNGTSISPTLVFRGTGEDQEPMLAVGAAGNAWIGAAVYASITGIIDGGLGPQQALELPRFLVGGRRGGPGGTRQTVVQLEDGVSPAVIRELRDMGHIFQMISLRGELRMGYGAAVLIENGRAVAGADPRRSGAAQAAQ